MITQNDSILIGLSGGADSVALLYSMIELQKDYNLSISAVHINHQLRGEESDGDEEFCRQLCNKLNPSIEIVPISQRKNNVAYNAFLHLENGRSFIINGDTLYDHQIGRAHV